jgi:predicted Zn-dependent protease
MVKYFLLTLNLLILSACQTLELSSTERQDENLKRIYDTAMNAYENKDWKKAEPALLHLTKVFPKNAQVWFKLGNIYARDNRAKDAIKIYQEALIRSPDNPKIWHNLAVIQLREASLSFFQVTQHSKKDDPLFIRANKILHLYDEVQTNWKP